MTTEAAQLQFAAEFTLFIAAVAALAVMALSPGLLVRRGVGRVAFVVGAASLALAAFLHGSLLVQDADRPSLVALRLVGLVGLAVSTARWVGPSNARLTATAGLVGLALAEVATATDHDAWGDVARGLGALAVAVALVIASRRAIAARVATSAAAVVLLVITLVAIALSVVLADNVEDEVAQRYGARAETETEVFASARSDALAESALLARTLRSVAGSIATVNAAAQGSPEQVGASQEVADTLAFYRDTFLRDPFSGPLVVVGPAGGSVASIDATPIVLVELVGSQVVAQVVATGQPADAIVVAEEAYAVGASPVFDGSQFLGVAVVTSRLDDQFLASRIDDPASEEQGVGLAIADRRDVYSAAGPQPSLATVLTLAGEVLRENERATTVDGSRFVVAVPAVDETGVPFLSVTVNVPQARIDATRQDLFRFLFIVALAAALVAMVLAGYAGKRIGAGLAVLTAAAGELQQGRLSARAELDTDDELGVLAANFNQMAGSIQTMTDELRAAADDEAALRARLEGVVGGMGEALVAVDDRGRITDFNPAAEELLGIPARDALGRKLDVLGQVRDEDDVDLTTRFVKPVLESWTAQAEVVRIDESRVPVAVSAGPLRGVGGVLTGAVFVLRDVRQEREIEKMKTEFIANISHELRTPLTPVKGYSEILANREVPPDKVQQFAAEIVNGARQLERVTDQLVGFANMAAGHLQLHSDRVPPRDLLDSLAQRWQGRLDGRHRLTRRVARGTPDVVVDRRYIEKALDELVDNAVKYSPEGGRVRVSASLHENGHGPKLMISVDDQGVGIDPDRREAIFDDFSQADGSATRRFGGLGLGLALVNRIVRAHGGELACSSEQGRGTTVRMILPLEPAGRDMGAEG